MEIYKLAHNTIENKDWDILKPLVIMIEEIKLKYLGEYEYSEDY